MPANRVLFVGNGVNLVAERNQKDSWTSMLDELESTFVPEQYRSIHWADTGRSLGNLLRLQRIINFKKLSHSAPRGKIANWLRNVRAMQPTFAHHVLAGVVKQYHFSTIITTNYDLAFEKAFWPQKKFDDSNRIEFGKKVFHHIHGIAPQTSKDNFDDNGVIMSYGSYRNELNRLMRKGDSWLEEFCKNEVHVCGFGLGVEELLFWYALEYRLEKILNSESPIPEICSPKGINRVYIYIFYEPHQYAEKKQLADVLRSYSAIPILIPVIDGDYQQAWLLLKGKLSSVCDYLRHYVGVSRKHALHRFPNVESRQRNLTLSFVPSLRFPHLCTVSVPIKKLHLVDEWCFYCEIDRKISCWTCDAFHLKPFIENDATLHSRECCYFYLDYTTGDLFATKEAGVESFSLVCRLRHHDNIEEFENHIVNVTKINNL